MSVRKLTLLALSVGILLIQEYALLWLPTVQIYCLLIFNYSKNYSLKEMIFLILWDELIDKILFVEDIAQFFTAKHLADFVDWLGDIGALQKLKGLIIGKLCEYTSFDEHKKALLKVVNEKYSLNDLTIIANMNFGHTSPICILPYRAMMEIDCNKKTTSILENGVE